MPRPANNAGLLTALCVSVACAPAARPFVLLDFPTIAQIAQGTVFSQPGYQPGEALVLTYQIDEFFFAGRSDVTQEEAAFAVRSALDSWSRATNGNLVFVEADWRTVLNQGNPTGPFVGPPLEDWMAEYTACNFDLSCMTLPFPGWSAHIDFSSRPTGFTNTVGLSDFEMGACILGFAASWRSGQTEISDDGRLGTRTSTTRPQDAGNRGLGGRKEVDRGRWTCDNSRSEIDQGPIV